MIGIVVFTHGSVATGLVETAQTILDDAPGLVAVELAPDLDRQAAWARLDAALAAADTGGGVIVLVDMFGGTPSNLAMARLADGDVEVVTGVNLAMVLRAAQRREGRAVGDLAADVVAYGRRNVTSSAGWLRTSAGSPEPAAPAPADPPEGTP